MRFIRFFVRAIKFRSISSAMWVDAYEKYEREHES